jgi:hypothetical protein
MALLQKVRSFLDRALKNGVYELQGAEVVCGRGRRANQRLPISQLRAWQIHPEMGFDIIAIELTNGRQIRWIDRYDDLISILRRVAPERETSA